MLSRTMALAVATLAIGLTGLTSASATTVVRTDPGNLLAPAGTIITGGTQTTATASPTMTGGPFTGGTAFLSLPATGTITCGGFAQGVLTTTDGNPSVRGTLTTFALTPCHDTIPVINVTGCTAVPPLPEITVTATATGGTNTLTNLFKRCTLAGSPAACYYRAATATAVFTNANATLTYSNVSVQHTAPAGTTDDLGALCGSTGTFSADFPDIHTTGNRTLTVTTS